MIYIINTDKLYEGRLFKNKTLGLGGKMDVIEIMKQLVTGLAIGATLYLGYFIFYYLRKKYPTNPDKTKKS